MQIEQQLADIQNVVDDVLKLALSKGATQAEASMSKVQGIAVSSRMQEVENVEFTNDGGLGISVYVGKRKGSASTADLSKAALTLAVEKAVGGGTSGLAAPVECLFRFKPQPLSRGACGCVELYREVVQFFNIGHD